MSEQEYTATSLCMNIIKRLEHRPEIWQFRHPLYKKRIVHQQFWEELGSDLGVNDETLRKRWKHLKDQYRKELQRALETSDDLIQWQYFKPLSFYREEVLRRFKERSVAAAIDDIDSTSEPETADFEIVQEKPPPAKKSRQEIAAANSPEGRSARMQLLNQKRENRLKLAAVNRHLVVTRDDLETKVDILEKRINDPDYMFLLSIVPSMKQLSEIQKLQLKGKINDWLLQAMTEKEHARTTHVNNNINNLVINNQNIDNHDDLITIIKCEDDIITIKAEPDD